MGSRKQLSRTQQLHRGRNGRQQPPSGGSETRENVRKLANSEGRKAGQRGRLNDRGMIRFVRFDLLSPLRGFVVSILSMTVRKPLAPGGLRPCGNPRPCKTYLSVIVQVSPSEPSSYCQPGGSLQAASWRDDARPSSVQPSCINAAQTFCACSKQSSNTPTVNSCAIVFNPPSEADRNMGHFQVPAY